MECQIEGCRNKAVSFDSLNGIHQGVYINGVFGHCKYHTPQQIVEARQGQKEQLARSNSVVNPFQDVLRKKYGSDKAAG